MKRTFEKQFMLDLLWNNVRSLIDKSEIIENKIYSQNRWSITYDLIFKFEDRYYQTYYYRGATEQQDEGPWEYNKVVECEEVAPVEKTVIVYEPVK